MELHTEMILTDGQIVFVTTLLDKMKCRKFFDAAVQWLRSNHTEITFFCN